MGCPQRIIVAWQSMMQQLRIVNTLASGVGAPYARARSIPQGCPLSMLWLTALLAPLERSIQTHTTYLRSLADDLTVVARGPDHWVQL
eukprot:1791664-Alexandrium_andersonii.AAC.1